MDCGRRSVSMESVGDTGVCCDAQNPVVPNAAFAGLPEYCRRAGSPERVQARRITTLYGSLIWAEKDSAYVDSSAAARPLQPGWRRVFYRMEWGGLRDGYMRAVFWSRARDRSGGENGRRSGRKKLFGKHPADCVFLSRTQYRWGRENSIWN